MHTLVCREENKGEKKEAVETFVYVLGGECNTAQERNKYHLETKIEQGLFFLLLLSFNWYVIFTAGDFRRNTQTSSPGCGV